MSKGKNIYSNSSNNDNNSKERKERKGDIHDKDHGGRKKKAMNTNVTLFHTSYDTMGTQTNVLTHESATQHPFGL